MKSRLFVVNSDSLASTIKKNMVSILVPDLTVENDDTKHKEPKKKWEQTISDIMADMLQIEIGDYIFLWETKADKTQKNRIHGVYRAISKPYYECSEGEKDPFRIKIEQAYVFKEAIDEYDVLNNPFVKSSFWTIIGKKVADKSRGTTPLSIEESKNLITMLIGRNPKFSFVPFDEKRIIKVPDNLSIDYSKRSKNTLVPLSELNPSSLSLFDDNNVKYEKMLETILNFEMSNRNKNLFEQIGIDVNKVIWYSNYLPYSIEQSEMDYMVIESEDKLSPSKIFLIELMKTGIDTDHVYRTMMYSNWINETLALGENIVQPIIVCFDSVDFINGESHAKRKQKIKQLNSIIQDYIDKHRIKEPMVYTYEISNDGLRFFRKR